MGIELKIKTEKHLSLYCSECRDELEIDHHDNSIEEDHDDFELTVITCKSCKETEDTCQKNQRVLIKALAEKLGQSIAQEIIDFNLYDFDEKETYDFITELLEVKK